jgi:type I restriction enzyme S subunit
MMKRLGGYIRPVDVRNRDLKVTRLLGVSITKELMPSIANIVGTDLSAYKVVTKGQFAYGPVTSRNGDKISVALLDGFDDAIISQAYTVFEVIDKNALDPEYLMMWFRRPEFDRYARFHSHGSAREVFDWDEMYDVQVPVPAIEKQRETVAEYNTLQNRIETNKKLIATLEQTAQTLYRHTFVDNIDPNNLPAGWRMGTLGDVCSKLGSGATPKGGKESYCQEGISLIRSTNVLDYQFLYDDLAKINDAQAKALDGVTVESKDVLFNITGVSVARCCMVPDDVLPARVNQHVMIVRPSQKCMAFYLLCTLCYPDVKNTLLGISQAGSTREAITKDEMERFKIIVPNQESLQKFDFECSKIFERKNLATKENQTLTQMQTLLLSKMGA